MAESLDRLLSRRTGHFRYESGHHGRLWLDLDSLVSRPTRLRPIADELAAVVRPFGVDVVCGPMTGGAFLSQLVAATLDVGFAFTARVGQDYRLPRGLHAFVAGRTVAIVDDVVNAGSAARATVAELEAYGARVAVVASLLALGPAAPTHFAGRGIPFVRLADWPNELWTPADCPLCAAGVPLDDDAP